ncbi:MAG: ATP-binding cassette domain-containing protein [Ruminococcus callidus]
MATIQTEGLTYRYGIGTPFEKTAVDHVDLEIEAGSFVGIIGHTGSGKSTLIQHLNGLLRPTEGKVLLDGVDIWADKSKMRQMRFRVGLVFQYPSIRSSRKPWRKTSPLVRGIWDLPKKKCRHVCGKRLPLWGFPRKS